METIKARTFTARCYALIVRKSNRLLVMKERWRGVHLNKLPGGGLELGGGLLECLNRELEEEFTSYETCQWSHLHTPTHYFTSQFRPDEQLLLNYFKAVAPVNEQLWTLNPEESENLLGIEWLELHKKNRSWFTLESDRDAFDLLLERYS